MAKKKYNFDFMGRRNIAYVFSAILIIASIACIATQGLKFGIDFTGGTLLELGYSEDADLNAIRAALKNSEFSEAVVQAFGSPQDVLVRLPQSTAEGDADLSSRVLAVLPGADMRRIEFVGPQVGEELAEDGALAMIYALAGIMLYVMIRFTWKFATGAIVALVHDVVITVGFFAATQMEFDLPVLAAILAVIGYSLNDTIVVFDRSRENFRRQRKQTAVEVLNSSINQTLSRTLITGITTLLVLFALFFLGGELIHAFSTALIVGIVIGTYSSIYIASPVTLILGVEKVDLMPVVKEAADGDSKP
jgi:preprotein translocase subunit SecF